MKAVVANAIGPYAEVLSLQTVPELELAEGTALVRVLSAGLAFPDVLVVEGKHMMRRDPPFTPGQEVCGQVVAIGEGVTSLAVGQHVFGPCSTGGLAEFALVSADDCFKAPSGMDPHVAAGFELNYGTSWHGLVDLAALRRDETLLVLGASGGVGLSAIAIGVALGARVVAAASSEARLDACRQAGAHLAVSYAGGGKALKAALADAGVYGSWWESPLARPGLTWRAMRLRWLVTLLQKSSSPPRTDASAVAHHPPPGTARWTWCSTRSAARCRRCR